MIPCCVPMDDGWNYRIKVAPCQPFYFLDVELDFAITGGKVAKVCLTVENYWGLITWDDVTDLARSISVWCGYYLTQFELCFTRKISFPTELAFPTIPPEVNPVYVDIVRIVHRHTYSTVNRRGSQLLSPLFGLYHAAFSWMGARKAKFPGDQPGIDTLMTAESLNYFLDSFLFVYYK